MERWMQKLFSSQLSLSYGRGKEALSLVLLSLKGNCCRYAHAAGTGRHERLHRHPPLPRRDRLQAGTYVLTSYNKYLVNSASTIGNACDLIDEPPCILRASHLEGTFLGIFRFLPLSLGIRLRGVHCNSLVRSPFCPKKICRTRGLTGL